MRGSDPKGYAGSAILLGIGLGGFFDGILLHQILQWHHLLSLVPGETFRDLGTQILADGLFHVLMYVITATALTLLWRRRRLLSRASDWRMVSGSILLGFGLWNLADVGLFHWVAGIHRIRIDVPDPMTYDVAWFVVLGLVPAGIGWLLMQRAGGRGSGSGYGAAVGAGLLALLAAPLAGLPPPNSKTALVLFAPGGTAADAVKVAQQARTPILWLDPAGRMMAIPKVDQPLRARLYMAGALLVTRSAAIAGCAVAVRSDPVG